jgi:hypothetical protein
VRHMDKYKQDEIGKRGVNDHFFNVALVLSIKAKLK